MKKFLGFFLVSCFLCSGAQAAGNAPGDPVSVEQAVTKVLDAQQAAWNSGNIDAYMSGYWNSKDLVFTSGGKIRKGFEETLQSYKKKYKPGDMGKLAFSDLEFTPISPEAALVLGRWELTEKGAPSGGVFTLLFRKIGGEWKIVHDHTSARAAAP